MKRILAAFALLLLAATGAFAVNPDEMLDDPALEQRARDISAKLRCLVCQNQSIDDSDAELARDLRVIVRERIVDGDTNEEVMNFVVSRYGEFVLLQPRMSVRNMLLWGTPVIGLAARRHRHHLPLPHAQPRRACRPADAGRTGTHHRNFG
jgi:cytochrome c-type biogenesis protein CcmH